MTRYEMFLDEPPREDGNADPIQEEAGVGSIWIIADEGPQGPGGSRQDRYLREQAF